MFSRRNCVRFLALTMPFLVSIIVMLDFLSLLVIAIAIASDVLIVSLIALRVCCVLVVRSR